MKKVLLSSIPSIDKILKDYNAENIQQYILLSIIREEVEFLRINILNNDVFQNEIKPKLYKNISKRVEDLKNGSIKKVINGTGIILHTGLGRAPFTEHFFDEMKNGVSGYFNLEFDLKSGKRGERLDHVREYLNLLSTSENSVVVNNNAAALILILNTLAKGKEVIVSRGELIEIGGSFRLPDVIEKSGAIIKEIGTTNRTHLKDYELAISENTGAILMAHTSNYKINGFIKSPGYKELIELAGKNQIPVILDQGSGDFDSGSTNIKELIQLGFDVVCFSGDKLLGGPQSGIILGKDKLLQKIHTNPFYRAFRCDKFTIFALKWTLEKIINNENKSICKTMLLNRSKADLNIIAKKIIDNLNTNVVNKIGLKISDTHVELGSGSLPTEKIESIGLVFTNYNAEKISNLFRNSEVPVIGYINKDKYIIDLKAVPNDDVDLLIWQIKKVLQKI